MEGVSFLIFLSLQPSNQLFKNCGTIPSYQEIRLKFFSRFHFRFQYGNKTFSVIRNRFCPQNIINSMFQLLYYDSAHFIPITRVIYCFNIITNITLKHSNINKIRRRYTHLFILQFLVRSEFTSFINLLTTSCIIFYFHVITHHQRNK